jgi:hypothetical protein
MDEVTLLIKGIQKLESELNKYYMIEKAQRLSNLQACLNHTLMLLLEQKLKENK